MSVDCSFMLKVGNCVVLFLYGFVGIIEDVREFGEILVENGYIVYVLNFRGYGDEFVIFLKIILEMWYEDVVVGYC